MQLYPIIESTITWQQFQAPQHVQSFIGLERKGFSESACFSQNKTSPDTFDAPRIVYRVIAL